MIPIILTSDEMIVLSNIMNAASIKLPHAQIAVGLVMKIKNAKPITNEQVADVLNAIEPSEPAKLESVGDDVG